LPTWWEPITKRKKKMRERNTFPHSHKGSASCVRTAWVCVSVSRYFPQPYLRHRELLFQKLFPSLFYIYCPKLAWALLSLNQLPTVMWDNSDLFRVINNESWDIYHCAFYFFHVFSSLRINNLSLTLVAHACNPGYLRDWDQEVLNYFYFIIYQGASKIC
jgi:hypothetical protein